MEPPLTYLLHQLVWAMDAVADRELQAAHGIPYSRFHPLAVLVSIEPATQHQLAVALGVTDAAVSRSIGQLVEAGFVEIGVSPAHGRHNRVTLTPAGRRLAKACTKTLECTFASVLAATGVDGDAYTDTTVALTETLRKALHSSPGG